jgi:uncharacterized membrane protein YgaE (UPF0421/DUF939 family)
MHFLRHSIASLLGEAFRATFIQIAVRTMSALLVNFALFSVTLKNSKESRIIYLALGTSTHLQHRTLAESGKLG